MASERRPRRRPWRKSTPRLSSRLLCCSCLRGEEQDPLQEQEKKINGGPQHPHLDQVGSGEREAIQITVEDLGIVNTGFSLLEEDLLTPRSSIARSASSASACPKALKKKRLKPLSSLPIQHQAKPVIICTSGEDDEEEEDDTMLFASGTNSTAASRSLLTTPVINLIPPTPSDIADDDQFFDVNSDESAAHTSGSDGSFAAGDQESYEEKMETVEAGESTEGFTPAEQEVSAADGAAEPEEGLSDESGEDRESVAIEEGDEEKTKPRFLRSAYQVAPLPECPQKRSFNTGINLLSFTEHNLDDLSSRDVSCCDMLKADVCLLPLTTNMDTFPHQRRLLKRSCSLGDAMTRSATFHGLTETSEMQEEEGSPRQRRQTVASCTPQSTDQNGNFPEKDMDRQVAKSLGKLNTEEVCQWFTSIGLQKCLPFIREAKLCGADIASVNVNTLDTLHITTLEDREQLLAAIYNELHPPTTITQRLDSLLESTGPNNVETFTATLVSMSKSKSSPHVSCLSMNRRSLKLRNNSQNYMVQKNSQLIEITITASERIVHLRTPKETTVGKIMDSCIKMLGVTEDKSLFILKEKQESSEELPPDQQIGSLLTSTSEKRQLELHLCKAEKSSGAASQNNPDTNENRNLNKNVQVNQPAKEERIKELNQQVDSLQNVILQVQELHHGLVAFCSELKNMDGDVNVDRLDCAELKQRLELVKSRLNDKRESLQALRDNINDSTAHKKKQLDVRLLEKMKLNCQVFKEEISMVHLNRQAAHLQNALQECYAKEKARKKSVAFGSLSQLVSLQSPAMLLVVQENPDPDGRYGFTCRYRGDSGLVVVKADDSHLCVDDRLVEVNGVPVVNSTQEELDDVLLQAPSAQIVVLRQPPPALASQQHPLLPQHTVNPDPTQAVCPERDVVTMETPPRSKVMAI